MSSAAWAQTRKRLTRTQCQSHDQVRSYMFIVMLLLKRSRCYQHQKKPNMFLNQCFSSSGHWVHRLHILKEVFRSAWCITTISYDWFWFKLHTTDPSEQMNQWCQYLLMHPKLICLWLHFLVQRVIYVAAFSLSTTAADTQYRRKVFKGKSQLGECTEYTELCCRKPEGHD